MEHLLFEEMEARFHNTNYGSNDIEALLKNEMEQTKVKLVVLDDDPTGVQTVHDVNVYTDWKYESILQGFQEPARLFFILTNSRALTREQTSEVHKEIGRNIVRAAKETGKRFLVISRGDSTLRGHYPLETDLLRDELEVGTGHKVDGEILIPFFEAGGRYTIDNIHYVKYQNELVPVAETEFARDKTFGYTKSDLREYIEEKTEGKYLAGEVKVISLEELRSADFVKLQQVLMDITDFRKIIVNAISPKDLEIFCIALYRAIREGKSYLLRTAADFVKAVGAVQSQPLLTKENMLTCNSSTGGIIVIGSHTTKTTAQLEALKQMSGLQFIEFNSDLVLEDRLQEEVERVVTLSSDLIRQGKTVVTYTRRKLLTLEQDTGEKALLRSVKISEAVKQLVSNLTVTPRFVIAKGGITSSDIGVKALNVRKAYVLGQALPGIPVWRTDNQSRFPGIPYIIFPGNVGEDNALQQVVKELLRS